VAASAKRESRRIGRTPGSPPNRESILAAARRQFIERGYDGATIRSIAAAAGVDPALVHHYFGTKDQLLLAALQQLAVVEGSAARLAAGEADGLGERVLRATLQAYESSYQALLPALVGLVRSAITHDSVAGLLRDGLSGGGLVRLIEALELPQPRLRAALIGSELLGLAMARYVVRLEPIASAEIDLLVAWYAPTLQRYLTEPLPGNDAA
jgi:AcrR family transcriptional regulator